MRLYQEWSNAQQQDEFVKIIETSMNGAAETVVDEC
jgi:flavorubredoxin